MNATDIYRQAIKRTDLYYGVARREVDGSWNKKAETSPCAVQIKPSYTKLYMMMRIMTARSNLSPPMRTPSPSD